jgi:hypothetical protein
LTFSFRGRYQALSALLSRVGADILLTLQPAIVQTLMDAFCIRDVCSSVCRLLGQILKALLPKKADTALAAAALTSRKRKCEDVILHANEADDPTADGVAMVLCSTEMLQDFDTAVNQWRQLWLPHLCAILSKSSSDVHRRTSSNMADYLVPEVLKIDPSSLSPILVHLRTLFASGSSNISYQDLLWAMCSVCVHARLLGCAGADIVDDTCPAPSSTFLSGDKLTVTDISYACCSNEPSTRLLALNVVASTHRQTMPLTSVELSVLQKALPFSLKCVGTHTDTHRQDLVRALKCICVRVSECTRIAIREKRKALLRLTQENGKSDSAVTTSDVGDSDSLPPSELRLTVSVMEEQLRKFRAFHVWLYRCVLDALYPGTTSDKEIVGLNVLEMIVTQLLQTSSELAAQALQQQTNKRSHESATRGSCASSDMQAHTLPSADDVFVETMQDVYLTKQTVQTLISLCIHSSWDKTRLMAADLLVNLPFGTNGYQQQQTGHYNKSLPGYGDPADVNALLRWGDVLVGSARQRESDAGARLLHCLFVNYCIKNEWSLSETSSQDSSNDYLPMFRCSNLSMEDDTPTPCLLFLGQLCTVLERRTEAVDALFQFVRLSEDYPVLIEPGVTVADDAGARVALLSNQPLVHGTILTLKYCISAADKYGRVRADIDSWPLLMKRLLAVSIRSLTSAMMIVAEAKSDVPFQMENSSAITRYTTGAGGGSAAADPRAACPTIASKVPVQAHANAHMTVKAGGHSHMAASFMNTNSSMGHVQNRPVFKDAGDVGDEGGLPSEDAADQIGSQKGPLFQRAVVAAWLIVKEACALISLLVAVSPPPSVGNRTAGQELLSVADISHAGTFASLR